MYKKMTMENLILELAEIERKLTASSVKDSTNSERDAYIEVLTRVLCLQEILKNNTKLSYMDESSIKATVKELKVFCDNL